MARALRLISQESAGREDGALVDEVQPVDAATLALEEGLAASALAMEDYAAGVRHCSRLVQLDPAHFEGWYNLGLCRQQMGDWEEAVLAYHQAGRLRPDQAAPRVNLGVARQALEDPDGAAEAYHAALEIEPQQTQALWNLSLIEADRGNQEAAEGLLQRLVEANPHSEPGRFRLACLLFETGRWEESAAEFAACLRLRRPWPAAAVNRALALTRCGDHDTARQILESVVREQPEDATAWKGLAALAVAAGDLANGMEIRKRLVGLKESAAVLSFNLGVVAEGNGLTAEALRLYGEALKERPRFAEALVNLGHLFRDQGREQDATECWRRAAAIDERYAVGYFRRSLSTKRGKK